MRRNLSRNTAETRSQDFTAIHRPLQKLWALFSKLFVVKCFARESLQVEIEFKCCVELGSHDNVSGITH